MAMDSSSYVRKSFGNFRFYLPGLFVFAEGKMHLLKICTSIIHSIFLLCSQLFSTEIHSYFSPRKEEMMKTPFVEEM
jgi:hypothetical protein